MSIQEPQNLTHSSLIESNHQDQTLVKKELQQLTAENLKIQKVNHLIKINKKGLQGRTAIPAET